MFFLNNLGKADYYKLNKLCYYLDFDFYEQYERPVSEITYAKLGNGTVVNNYKNLFETINSQIKHNPDSSFTELKTGVKEAIGTEVERCLRLWGSAGRAAEVLTQCEPWTPIEQITLFNVEQITDQQIHSLMDEGHRVLSSIPGVREVFTGEAVKEGEKFHFCWRVRFCHKSVLDSYREHPDFIAFTNKLFSPVASGQVSIDYQDSQNVLPTLLVNSVKIPHSAA